MQKESTDGAVLKTRIAFVLSIIIFIVFALVCVKEDAKNDTEKPGVVTCPPECGCNQTEDR